MTGRTHDLAAITALSVIVLIVPMHQVTLGTAGIAVLANLIGGIAPDIDEPTAPLWRNLPIGGYVGRFIGHMLGGHRFITHSLLGVGLLGGLAYYLLKFLRPIMPAINLHVVWYAFIIGVVSHLVMDSLTKEGVPWLLPIPVKFGFPPVRAWRITTGKAMETLIIFHSMVAVDVYVVATHYHQILNLLHRQLV